MILFELDDFDYWVDNSITQGQGTEVFAPMFVFMIDWAVKRGESETAFLTDPFLSQQYLSLVDGKISFVDFVLNALDGKLLDTNFSDGMRQFVRDYVEYDGYSEDLVRSFGVNLWELPHSFDNAAKLYDAIDVSLKNYRKNKETNPELVSFADNA